MILIPYYNTEIHVDYRNKKCNAIITLRTFDGTRFISAYCDADTDNLFRTVCKNISEKYDVDLAVRVCRNLKRQLAVYESFVKDYCEKHDLSYDLYTDTGTIQT